MEKAMEALLSLQSSVRHAMELVFERDWISLDYYFAMLLLLFFIA